ncbi:DUF6443 domain-containing protein [uncultured Aquimarina sp.]|uniref:DUF6443 domain-containing protein n=1 Tax=uncultured Aquimarina sp. TaxID=575652 RepID=UPI0026118F3F|nr:DUF6443 domain-containing protein [uncultured Aquimarina sp.]
MKKLFPYITVALLFVGISVHSQVADTVTIQDETITSSSDPALLNVKAGQSIIIKPTTWIQPGTVFSAVITEDPYLLPALDTNENYVFTRVYQSEKTNFDQVKNNSDVIESITYFDGLGRAKQQIGIKASNDKKDIVTHIVYDAYGRQDKQYLPFEKSSTTVGAYNPVNVITNINTYYKSKYGSDFEGIDKDDTDNFNAYSESIFEPSPLNRVLEQGAPGKDWKADPESDTDHTIKFDWHANETGEVAYFTVDFANNNTESPTLVQNDFYDPNELLVTTTKDENWQPEQTHPNDHTTREYKDKLGRVILKRTFNEGVEHDTYYVYDDFGNLTYVIPPKVDITDNVSAIELSELCYQYKYDGRNRLIEKKIPGKGLESIVYNKLDQPVMTQDANQKAKNEWLFTKYDAFGRVTYTGIISNVGNREYMEQILENSDQQYETKLENGVTLAGTTIYYSNVAKPIGVIKTYTINYYDNYTFDHSVTNPGTVLDQTVTSEVKGLPTGTKVRVLGTDDWITTVTYYDAKGRPIYVHSTNEYLNTVDIIESRLDFAGKVLETKTTHTKGSNAPIVTVDTFTYDHIGRLLDQKQTINNQAQEHMVANTYDAFGQLEYKEVGGGLQKVDYTYNVRGWLKTINEGTTNNGDLFGFAINYNTVEGRYDIPKLYNGNIAQTIWKTANDNIKRSYGYEYDPLNRIKESYFRYNENLTDASLRSYDVRNIDYDKNGNISSLIRYNEMGTNDIMDNLSYEYDSGNKLSKVTDSGNSTIGFIDGTNTNDDYVYDLNGNMTIDRNKGITGISYNHLNLPTAVAINDQARSHVGNISYIYDATGMKLKKIVSGGSSLTTEYAGNYIYENGQLQFMSTAEGYVEPVFASNGVAISSFDYIYQYKDHLGNIRLSYADKDDDGKIDVLRNDVDVDGDNDYANEILEENNYYPFGLKHEGYNSLITSTNPALKYKYNGKELNEELGLDWHDYGFRNYDPSLGRWMNIDNLAEQYQSMSPYNYTMNNPVFFVDPDGQEVIIHFDKTNNRLYIYDDDKWDDNLETKAVSAEEYKFSFGEDEEKYNQILVVHNVFSGGNDSDADGEIEYGADENQREIPNGEYDLVDNKTGSNPDHYRIDSKTDGNRYNDRYDDPSERNSKGELRDGFRLHLGTLSWGCVTICGGPDVKKRQKEWNVLDQIIQSTSTRTVNDRRGRQSLNPFSRLTVYGTITVSGQNPKPKKGN